MLPDVEQQLAAYAGAAADLHDVSYGPDQFKLGATLATRLVPGCRASAILRQHRRTTETVAATSDTAPVVARAEALAKLLVLALTCGHKIEHQSVALEGRTVIGQAQGILMSQLDVSADDAFSHLQRLSQNGNRKLTAAASEIVGDLVTRRDQTRTGRPAATGLGTAGVIHPPAADTRKT